MIAFERKRLRVWGAFLSRAADLPEVRSKEDAIAVANEALEQFPDGPEQKKEESPKRDMPIAAGLAVRAKDTDRVLMLQRSLNEDDPASGKWEFPGGHIDGREAFITAAHREWEEEVGLTLPYGKLALEKKWRATNGKYVGFVYDVDSEDEIDLRERDTSKNPDGDTFESVAWVHPRDLANHNLRSELLEDLPQVLTVLNVSEDSFFSHDIENPKAQAVLNAALEASRRLSQRARRDLEIVLLQPEAEVPGALAEWLRRYREALADVLSTTQLAALLEGAREVARDIPQVPMLGGAPIPAALGPQEAQELVERVSALEEGMERDAAVYALPPEQQAFVRQALAQGGGPPAGAFAPQVAGDADRAHFAVIDEAARLLRSKNVVSPESFAALDAAARQKALAVAGAASLDAVDKVRQALADVVQSGADYEAFRAKALEAVDVGTFLSEPHMETVFRTVVQAAFSDGQMHVLQQPFVRGGFPYAAYEAIHDDRVRPDHLSLERCGIGGSNIYRINDPVFQLFRPSWDYNCRCSWYPITVRQAAERGVAEAVDWLRVGLEPSPPAFVAMPPFRPPAGFQRSVAGASLSLSILPDAPVVRRQDADRVAAQLDAIESVAALSQRVGRIGELLASDAEAKHSVLEEFVLAVRAAEANGREAVERREAAVRAMLEDMDRREAALRAQRVADEASLAALHDKHLAEVAEERRQMAELMARERRQVGKIFDAAAETVALAAEFPVLVNVQVDPALPAPIAATPEPQVVRRRVAVRREASGDFVGELVQESASADAVTATSIKRVRVSRDSSGEWVGEIL